ncbi:MAG: tetratricopeptide repeat protein [Planctomycetes bacterium]|nr:tetratricopeptide repeat protein [Planctomycetota bacterium]
MSLCTLVTTAVLLAAPQDEDVQKLLRAGDDAYTKRDQQDQAAKAVESFKMAIALDEACVEAYWKIARTYYWLGSREQESAKAAPLYREGIDYGKIAISIDENCIEAHFWLAVMYGLFGQAKGILQSLDLVDPMKAELEWVLKKDEKFMMAGPHRVLGRLYFKLPSFKGGDREKAKQHLRRAIELAPQNLLNYYYLAEVHYNEGDFKAAKENLLKLLEQPDDPNWLPECRQQREDAKRLLAAVEKG